MCRAKEKTHYSEIIKAPQGVVSKPNFSKFYKKIIKKFVIRLSILHKTLNLLFTERLIYLVKISWEGNFFWSRALIGPKCPTEFYSPSTLECSGRGSHASKLCFGYKSDCFFYFFNFKKCSNNLIFHNLLIIRTFMQF